MRTRIKICGLTREEDIEAAVSAGADAIGFVFYPKSKRCLTPVRAAQLRRGVPAFVDVVALFVNAQEEEVRTVLGEVGPDLLQFHGAEPGSFSSSFSRPYVKAVPMASVDDAVAYVGLHPAANGFLLDSHALGALGGSGETFDWKRAPRLGRATILAGGLNADNVAQAIALVRPYAVDVSSGIETAPGIKDPARMRRFVEAVRNADAGIGK